MTNLMEELANKQDIDLCKVLLITSNVPNDDNATNITIKNMFSEWPLDKVAIVYISLDKNTPQTNYPVFHISDIKYIRKKQSDRKGLMKALRSSKSEVKGVSGAAADKSMKGSILNYIHTIASSHKALLPYKYGSALDRFIADFSPGIIYSPLQSMSIMDIACKISDRIKVPIVPHFMDDWPNTIYEGDPLLVIPRLRKAQLLRRVFKRSEISIVISEKMAREYQTEYRKEFVALMNCVDIHEPVRTDRPANGNLIFSYFGGLHLLRWQTLKLFFESLKKNPAYASHQSELRIYAPDADRDRYKHEFAHLGGVIFCDRISQGELIGAMQRSTYLVHVESFDEKIKQYTRLSISTKIPEYLAAQKPIIAIGPADIASIEYLRDNDCAHVISDLTGTEFHDVIENSLSEDLNKRLLSNAWQLFLKNHEKKGQQKLLKWVFESSLDKWNSA
ncbi:MAG: hypothetical protein JST50_03735 [Bacteroidetes bacterium]|jgi:hypothetical protein|nr:hypothetical protein [Bacteroidota bacterium]